MIDLTPLEVRKKKGDFRVRMRGYERGLVDDFLDLVAERLDALVRENVAFSDQIKRLKRELGEYKEQARLVTEALVTAQEIREEARRQAMDEANLIRRQAESDALNTRTSSGLERQREEEAIRRLRARRGELVRTYRIFLQRELSELNIIERSLGLNEGGRAPEAAPLPEDAAPAEDAAEDAGSAKLDSEIESMLSNLEERE